jgi:hypothetical protein
LLNEADGHTTITIDETMTAPETTLECPRFYYEGGMLSRLSDPP